jgi:DNA-binding PadR family transcriptional regulator
MATSTRLLVLGVVKIFQPVHGYDVRRELLSWRVDQWANVAPGSIYNALKTLAKDSLLEIVGTDQVGGRPERTTYRLTKEGESELSNLLRETWWKVEPPLDPLMPAVSFLPMLPPSEVAAALRNRVTQIEGLLKQFDFAIGELPSATTPAHVRELYRLSGARLSAEIGWAKDLAARLDSGAYCVPVPAAPPAARKGQPKKPDKKRDARAEADAPPRRGRRLPG